MDDPNRTICLESLRQQIALLEGAERPGDRAITSSGCPALDELLPWHGFRRGALVEWLSAADGAGAWTLALLAAREACRNGGMLVVMDTHREFFPPAAIRLGIEPEQIVVVHATNTADADWAMDQALRSPAVAAVLAWPETLGDRTFRRWQLAAEEGGCLGLLLRPEAVRPTPSWADVRLAVEPLPTAPANRDPLRDARQLRITMLHCRGATAGRHLDVEIDNETHLVHPVTLWTESTVDRALWAV